MNRSELLALLDEKKISYQLTEHEPVHTIEEMRQLGLLDQGTVGKNLFLRDDKGKKHYLVFCRCDKNVDLKDLRPQIGSTRLSFASDERLMKHLQLTPGAVTPLGLLNNEDHQVTLVIDRDLEGCSKLGVHPMDNQATLWIAWDDLQRIVNELGNPVCMARI